MQGDSGKPDVVFTRWRVAVFVDGAFWHGHPDHFNPSTASSYWREKITRTQQRDRAADAALSELGWSVVRFWDFDVKSKPGECLERVLEALRTRGMDPNSLGVLVADFQVALWFSYLTWRSLQDHDVSEEV